MLSTIKRAFYILKVNPALFLKRVFLEFRAFFLDTQHSKRKSLNGVIFEFDFGEDPNIKRMYAGFYEMEVIHTMKRLLEEGDTFIDVGANIGYVSCIAAGLVGTIGEVHSFEPVPRYFQRLHHLAEANKKYTIVVNQVALGDSKKEAEIYVVVDRNIGNNTMLPGLLQDGQIETSIKVPVQRLDSYIKEKGLQNIKMIKIDVEGFEFPVLKGLETFFQKGQQLPFIICEICPDACDLLEYKIDEFFNYMKKFSYLPFDPLNSKKRLRIGDIQKEQTINVLFRPYST